MNIKVEQSGACRRLVHVEMPADAVTKEVAEIVEAYQGVARIPGFRPGKAPVAMVKRKFMKDILDEVKGRLVPQGYQAAMKQEKLESVAVLDVKEGELKEGLPFSFTITVDVAPDFELPQYKGLKLEAKSTAVTDSDIEDVLKNIREQNAKYTDVSGRAVKPGDMVQVDFEGTCEGKSFAEISPKAASLGGTKDFWLIADEANEFLPGFSAGLMGANIGDTRQIEVKFPEKFVEESVAGKTAQYSATVKGLREKELPPMDEEFIKSMGVETEVELRDRIKTDLGKMRADNERGRIEGEIIKSLASATKLDVPDSVLAEETQQVVYDMVRSNTSRGVGNAEIEANKEQLIGAASQTATDRVKTRYILRKIAATEKIVATEQEIHQRIAELAQKYKLTPEAMEKELEKNNSLGRVADEVRLLKTVSWLYDNAQIQAA